VATQSRCPGCGEPDKFEAAPLTPEGATESVTVVRCAECGTVVGVQDPVVVEQLEIIETVLSEIALRLGKQPAH